MLEELKELFFESCQKKQNLSEEKVLELKQAFESEMRTIEEVVSLATRNDFVPVLEYFAKNGGNLNFIINDGSGKVNLLNIASEEDALNVINYLLDNNIFSVDESVDANSKTPFHSAVEGNKITAAKLLLERNANINAKYLGHNCNVFSTTIGKVFGIYEDENGIEFDYLEMTKFLVKYGVQIPHDIKEYINIFCSNLHIQRHPTKGPIKDFLISIKQLEDLQGNDFINAYEALAPEVQEIWDIRTSREHLKKLAEFISGKFSNENIIKYEEYAALREYNSLPKHKKDALEIFLPDTNFTSDDLIKVDNYIKNHFFEIAGIGNLSGSAFEILGPIIIPMITQYLSFEDNSIKIAGADSDI